MAKWIIKRDGRNLKGTSDDTLIWDTKTSAKRFLTMNRERSQLKRYKVIKRK